MPSWLAQSTPKLFGDLAVPFPLIEMLEKATAQSNPPHLLIAGPSGVGKSTIVKLVARQLLGPGWQATTHVLQARDLLGKPGAMSVFEAFLRPEGNTSSDTLAGRTSLDAFDQSMSVYGEDVDPPPSGVERTPDKGYLPISRLIVVEDADYLGFKRQPYLRRMMETTSTTSRFIFTAKSPSRVIDALRSRMLQIRIPATSRSKMIFTLNSICESKEITNYSKAIEDIAFICGGNLRKAILLLELLSSIDKLDDRKYLQELVNSTTNSSVQHALEEALRGRVHLWRWEKTGGKNRRILKGSMGIIDQIMGTQSLMPEDILSHLHRIITDGRLLFDDKKIASLLVLIANCETKLKRSIHGRIQLERLFHNISNLT